MTTWQEILERLWNVQPGSICRVAVWAVEHPASFGMHLSTGLPLGQRATFVRRVGDTHLLAVDDFGEHYDVRLLPRHEPARPMAVARHDSLTWGGQGLARSQTSWSEALRGASVEQSIREAPGTTVAATTSLGALLGALSGTKGGTLVGALIGGLAGLAAVSVSTAETSPQTSQKSLELAQALAKLTTSLARTEASHADAGAMRALLSAPPHEGVSVQVEAAPERKAPKRRKSAKTASPKEVRSRPDGAVVRTKTAKKAPRKRS